MHRLYIQRRKLPKDTHYFSAKVKKIMFFSFYNIEI